MLEVTGNDIASLNDGDLRVLVTRLAIAELRKQNCPISSVTAGGDQDASDGGLDVRVNLNVPLPAPDFIPRRSTGFQVKKSDMSAKAIEKEMRPDGALRSVITDLVAEGGAYVIVSANSSLTDKALKARKKALSDALNDHPDRDKLHVDFYDQERIANWVNGYPGVAAWVQQLTGRNLSGWIGIGVWNLVGLGKKTSLLSDESDCLVDERTSKHERVTVPEGIHRLRESLRQPGQCVRLIGLSGVGKTRLVQALFEEGVGGEPLDASLAIYTDYSSDTVSTAREMARHFITAQQKAILVVDNCNPETHADLVRICSSDNDYVSLLTVEYDVCGDEPERTEVFRLMSASTNLLAVWLKEAFPDLSDVDRSRIAEFSDGNFRVARVIAGTLSKGETLGQLRDRDLFRRIFQQRHDSDSDLRYSAEDLALLYSFDGESTSPESELFLLSRVRGISPSKLFEATVELRRRGIVQSRGRWRAILPHAIANSLAASALERIPPGDFDSFCSVLPDRMIRSLSRRLGYLHDIQDAVVTVRRWLETNGPLGDLLARGEPGFEILRNIAPVAPKLVLTRLGEEIKRSSGVLAVPTDGSIRFRWIGLLRALAYEPELFQEATLLLTKLGVVDSSENNLSSARSKFSELFHLYLSGTQAPPELRRDVIRKLALSEDPALKRCASIALGSLLKTDQFMSSESFDFGARSRDWGWKPRVLGEIWDWYRGGLSLLLELADQLPDVRSILSAHVRGLWEHGRCFDELEKAAATLSAEEPWIEGWLAFRQALKYDRKKMPEEVRAQLVRIIDRLKPVDLLSQARAAVLNRISDGWDLDDVGDDNDDAEKPWRNALRLAENAGKALASDAVVRRQFLPEVLAEQHSERAYSFGEGLARGCNDLPSIWKELCDSLEALDPATRNPTLLGGFISAARELNSSFVRHLLDTIADSTSLLVHLPYFQARIGIDEVGIARLRKGLNTGAIPAQSFFSIANGAIQDAPSGPLSELVFEIADLEGGIRAALEVLHMRYHCDHNAGQESDHLLVKCGRIILSRDDCSSKDSLHDYRLKSVIETCLTGQIGRRATRQVCKRLRKAMDAGTIWPHDVTHTMEALFEVHPEIALDQFLLPKPAHRRRRLFADDLSDLSIGKLDAEALCRWADKDSVMRYPLLAEALGMFKCRRGEGSNEPSTQFFDVLERAPDKAAFLGEFAQRIYPSGWIGSLADALSARRMALKQMEIHPDQAVRKWIAELDAWLDPEIEHERKRDRQSEESFE
jgi:hypothetical protein